MILAITACVPGSLSPAAWVATLRAPIKTADPFIPVPPQSQSQTPIASVRGTPLPSGPTPTPFRSATPSTPLLYYTQAGDTLDAVSKRFDVTPEEITSNTPIPPIGLLSPGQLLLIPPRLGEVSSSSQVLPDSEIVYSPSALDFDIFAYVKDAKGFLAANKEWLSTGWNDGAAIVQRVSLENSINPRLLLSILEYQSGWVTGQPANLAETDYPIGRVDYTKKGLYLQLSWAVQQLNIGYYGWRAGSVKSLVFPNGETLRLAPDLNAGSVALLYLFSKLYNRTEWAGKIYGDSSLTNRFEVMFGSPWLRAQSVEPLFPPTLTQPPLELPFLSGRVWSFTGGPHSAWGPDGARAALDFAPSSTEHGCVKSDDWVTAMASGLVVRSATGVLVVDLDGDGFEQTGWSILYLHVSSSDKVAVGTWVNQDDRLGHPSCEGGAATGTHVHVARKYNGEWILADGPLPFILSGWRAFAGDQNYIGELVRGSHVVTASIYGTFATRISR